MKQGTKMRVTLYHENTGELVSDRLVEQATEFMMGSKVHHQGPIKLEVNLTSQKEQDDFIKYLDQLRGILPLVDPKKPQKSASKSIDKMLSDKEPLTDLLNTVKAKCKSQEDLIKYLRDFNFKFIASNVVSDFSQENPEIIKFAADSVYNKYQWMVRMMKEAKDPANDKYDWRLLFGIKIVGKEVPRVIVYLWGDFSEKLSLPWAKGKRINFKKVEKLYMFPEFMDYTERRRWRLENRKLTAHIEAKGSDEGFEYSKFFEKYKPYVKIN